MNSNRGFTFIELLITLAVIAICFLPLMRMFSVSLEQVYLTSDLTTGRYLVQEAMEKVKNSGFSERQLADLGDVWEPALNAPPLKLNNRYWRTFRKIVKGADPLEVRVQVYQVTSQWFDKLTIPRTIPSEVEGRANGSTSSPSLEPSRAKSRDEPTSKPLAEVVTLIEDLEWVSPE